MAEEEEEKKDKEEEEEEEEKKPKGKISIVGVIFFFLYLIVGGGAFGLVYMTLVMNKKVVPTEQKEKAVYIDEKNNIDDLALNLFPLETFLINLKGPEGEDHLKLTIQLEVFNQDVVEELTMKIPIIRDAVISYLVEKNREQLDSVQDKLFLKTQLTNLVNKMLVTGSIRSIYMTHFLIQ